MLNVDFHSHTHFSRCGLHSIIEMLTEARNRGLVALAITDHGSALKSSVPSTFFDRLAPNVVEGITLLKGMECNVTDGDGTIDFRHKFLPYMDIVLLGLHPNLEAEQPQDYYTSVLLKAIEKNPVIDIITHPEDIHYPVDFDALAHYAQQHNIVLELNNSKILYNRVTPGVTLEFLKACKRNNCRIAINSDAHARQEIGLDSSVRPLVKQADFPEELIVNSTAETAFAFLAECRAKRKKLAAVAAAAEVGA